MLLEHREIELLWPPVAIRPRSCALRRRRRDRGVLALADALGHSVALRSRCRERRRPDGATRSILRKTPRSRATSAVRRVSNSGWTDEPEPRADRPTRGPRGAQRQHPRVPHRRCVGAGSARVRRPRYGEGIPRIGDAHRGVAAR
ncbi:hypothetical protein DB32_001445 [Sandaracinus amylolyticus]|uniref:Uncharacterized protein n=1 Tax=Sandaracinus amylolyticus TaxID=927083 RepID=A0A0F6W0R3_9BACT|nr:hypothetical protein DB32_001445 [Sandaracinus amylolyticus]